MVITKRNHFPLSKYVRLLFSLIITKSNKQGHLSPTINNGKE